MPSNTRFSHPVLQFVMVLAAVLCIGFGQARAQGAPPSDNSPDTSSATAVELKARPTIALSGSAEWDDGLKAIQDSIGKLHDEMGKAGLQPGGRPLAVFVETDDKGFKYEAMIPLTAKPETPPQLGEGVRLAESPSGKTMKFEHRGSYDEIDTTYEAITAYLDEKGLEAQNLFIEEYLTMPKTSEDEDAEVDIYVFLK